MAVPTYTTDLALFTDFEGTVPTMSEFANYTAGRGQAISTDYPIQGTKHSDTVVNTTGQSSCSVDYGSNITWTSGWSFFSWLVWTAPGAIASQAAGGFVFIVGSSVSAYDGWFVGGNDFGSYPYGGWQNFAVNPEIAYSEQASGGPAGSYRYVGLGVDVTPTAVAKGSPLGIDVIRFGYGQFRVAGGSVGDGYATFTGMAAMNDNTSNRWGLFQKIEGGYKYKGHMILGYGALTEFTDSNKTIVIDNTQFVTSTFNTIEVRNVDSVINMTTIGITALGTVSKGRWVTTDNATVNLTNCSFTGMDVFSFASNSTLTGTTFRGCASLIQTGSTITGCIVEGATTADDVAFITSDDLTKISNSYFTFSDGHAIMLTSAHAASPTEHTFTGNTFTGYSGTPGSNLVESSGSTDAAIYNNSGKHLIINITDGTSPSVRNGAGATTTINSNIAVAVTIKNQAGDLLPGVEVAIFQDNAARTAILTSTPTDEFGKVTSSAASGLGGIIIRARQSTNIVSFLTSATGIDDPTDVITTLASANHNFQNGDRIVYSRNGGSQNIGINDNTVWYVRSITASTLSLHPTAADAIANTNKQAINVAGAETHLLDPVRFIAGSATGTIESTAFSTTITLITDNIATG